MSVPDDQTMARPDESETRIVDLGDPSECPTQCRAGEDETAAFAWSQEGPVVDDGDAFTEPNPQMGWRDSPRAFWVLAAAAAVLAVVVLAVSRPAPSTSPTTAIAPGTVTEQPAPSTVTVAPAPTTAVAASAETQDAQFLALTRLDGTYATVMNYGGAGHARLLCSRLEDGETHLYGTDNAKPTVYDIVDVFCPDFDPRGSAAVAANLSRATAG
jgi:hypothetical protein